MSTPLYIGEKGSELAWSLVGMDTKAVAGGEELKSELKKIKTEGTYQLVFVDEKLAGEVMEDVERLDEEALPAIVLTSGLGSKENLAQQKINQLMVKAIGSDIFSSASAESR